MDVEKGIELKETLVTKGEASFSFSDRRDRSVNPEDDDKYLAPIPPWTLKEIIVASLATIAVVLSIIILLLPFFNPLVAITGIFGLIVPPYAALQEQKITDCKGAFLKRLLDTRIEEESVINFLSSSYFYSSIH